MCNLYELGMILDDNLKELLNNDCFEKTESPENMINYINDFMLISFYMQPNGNSFLWSINLMKGNYNSLDISISIGSNIKDAFHNILNHSYSQKSDITFENGKEMLIFNHKYKQVVLHYENDILILAQIMIIDPRLYAIQYNNFSHEQKDKAAIEITDEDYKYRLGIALDDRLQNELKIDNFIDKNLNEEIGRTYSKENAITFLFLPNLNDTLVLSSISILNNEYSLYNIKIGNTLSSKQLRDIIEPKGFKLTKYLKREEKEKFIFSNEIGKGVIINNNEYDQITNIEFKMLPDMMPYIYDCYEAQIQSDTSSQKYCLYMTVDTELEDQLIENGFSLTDYTAEAVANDGFTHQYQIIKYDNMDLVLDVGYDITYNHKIVTGILIRSEVFSINGIHIGDSINEAKEILNKLGYIEKSKRSYVYCEEVSEYTYYNNKFYIKFKVFEDIIQTIYISRQGN